MLKTKNEDQLSLYALHSNLAPGQGTMVSTNKIMLGTALSFKQMWPFIKNKYFVLWNPFSLEFLILPILYMLLIESIWWIKQNIFAKKFESM